MKQGSKLLFYDLAISVSWTVYLAACEESVMDAKCMIVDNSAETFGSVLSVSFS